MPHNPIIFTDIDDTLLQSKGKCPAQTPLYEAGYSPQGELISLYSEQQKTLLNWFDTARVIPVTGRDTAALQRLTLPFDHEKIINHGVLILKADDKVDPAWLRLIESQVDAWRDFLDQLNNKLQHQIEQQRLLLRTRVIVDHGVPCYINIKGEADQFASLQTLLDEHKAYRANARIHLNGRNMALLPCYASKANAVQYLMDRYKQGYAHPLFIGAGDSHSDLPFMQLCHYMMVPNQSQINQMNKFKHEH